MSLEDGFGQLVAMDMSMAITSPPSLLLKVAAREVREESPLTMYLDSSPFIT